MADAKISALPAMTALAGTELLTGLQTATNANATPAQIETYIAGLGRTFAKDAGLWWPLAASAVAVPHTGDTSETANATITIPAGALGANGVIRYSASWSVTNSGNNKTMFVRLGGLSGTAFSTNTLTTVASYGEQRTIQNRNSQSSQIGQSATGVAGGFGAASGAIPTGAIDTSASTTLVFSSQLASSGETITLERYWVDILYKA